MTTDESGSQAEDITLSVEGKSFRGRETPMWLRSHLGSSETKSGEEIEIAIDVSGGHLLFQHSAGTEEGRAVSVPIASILQAVGEFWESRQ